MSIERFDLSGRRVVVTGGARGLGLGMGIGMAQAGAEVWALDVSSRTASRRPEPKPPRLASPSSSSDAT